TVGATKIEGASGTRWTYTASGPVTNLAARLAGLGRGDVINVGAETRRRLDGEFPFEALGDVTLRNLDHPVSVFRLTLPPAPGGAAAAPGAPAAGGRPRASDLRADRQPRPIAQKSAPKRSQGSRHSSVRSGSGVKNRFTA